MPNNLVPFPPPQVDADQRARAETERKQSLFVWADRILDGLDFADRVRRASTIDDLQRVTFDADTRISFWLFATLCILRLGERPPT
jgi:hypothetical protein